MSCRPAKQSPKRTSASVCHGRPSQDAELTGNKIQTSNKLHSLGPTSGMWWDVSDAPSPSEATVALFDLALDAVNADHYGQLIRSGNALPWAP